MNPLDVLLKKEPYIQLMIEDGILYDMRSGRKSNKVMATVEIRIVEKMGYSDSKSDLIKYKFQLNSITCPIWREIFQNQLKTESPVTIQGNELDIDSSIQKISSDFDGVKQAIALTNKYYQEGRVAVVEYAKKQEEERAKKTAETLRVEEERGAKIQDSYEKLKI